MCCEGVDMMMKNLMEFIRGTFTMKELARKNDREQEDPSTRKNEIEQEDLTLVLPEHLFLYIMLKLDVPDVGRCRCVCKSWKKTLSDTQFVKLHSDQSRLRSSNLFVFYNVGKPYKEPTERDEMRFTVVDLNNNTSHTIRNPIGSCKGHGHNNIMLGGCDLLCYITDDHVVELCNFRTGQIHVLPMSRCPTSPSGKFNCGNMYFGYFAARREYIVLHLMGTLANKLSFRSNTPSPSSSLWKVIEDPCPRLVNRGGILIGRFMYWTIFYFDPCWKSGENKGLIVSFDIEKEKFGIINRPSTPFWELHPSLRDPKITLIDLKGTLCLIDKGYMLKTNFFRLWAWKSTTNGSSSTTTTTWDWMEEYNIKLDFPVHHSVEICTVHRRSSMEGEIVITSYDGMDSYWHHDPHYYLYNPEKNRVRSIGKITYPNDDDYFIWVGFYWESLFSFEA